MEKKLVDPNKLCFGCMSTIENTNEVCPHCGFLKSEYKKPRFGLPLGEIINGKYLVGKVIGIGGFGITYIAWDFYQSKKVCIKEYFPRGIAARLGEVTKGQQSLDYQYSLQVCTQNTEQAKNAYVNGLKAYITEAENLSKFYLLRGIVSVRDFFYANSTAYIVMEFIDGIDMKKYTKAKGGKLAPQELFPLLKDVLVALNEVHKENIIHRDISPDNIMLTREMQAKLIDFGAAKDYAVSKNSPVLLKHGYAPIEQYYRDGKQGPYTDIYSMCATIYYLLTGKKVPKVQDRTQEDTLQPLRNLGVTVNEAQDNAIMKGLRILPEERYQQVNELYRDLYGEVINE